MATQEVEAWTYTNGFPSTLKQTKILVPRANEIKSIGTTPHMLVKIHACSLNPVDVQIQNLPKWNIPIGGYRSPKGTCCDFSGTVVAGGRTGFQQGDEVFGLTLQPFAPAGGALAQMAEFNMAGALAVRKPKEWSHEQAASLSLVWLTAKASIESVAPWVESTSSKRIAVLGGSSSTGMYTVMLAKRRGWKVISTSSERNKDFILNTLKADSHVDYTKQNVRSGVTDFKPDAVIDCVGGTDCIGLPTSKRYVSIVGDKTGRMSMGGPYTYYDYFAPFNAAKQWLRWARGRFGLGESYDVIVLKMKKEWLEEAKETLQPDDIVIDSVFPFDDAMKAFERMNTGRARGKVVVKIADGKERSRF